MFRIKVAASLLLVFVLVGVVTYLNVADTLETDAVAGVEQRLRIAQQAVSRIRRLNDYAALAKAKQVGDGKMGEILAKPIESFADPQGLLPIDDEYRYQIHRLMNEEVKIWKERFTALSEGKAKASSGLEDFKVERPDLFVVLDQAGIGVANANDLAWFGPKEANMIKDFPVLSQVVAEGRELRDIWFHKGALMNVVAVPVRHAGRVVGAVVLGFRLTDAEAKRDKSLVEAEIAFFMGERLSRSSTFDTETERLLQTVIASKKLYADLGKRELIKLTLGKGTYLAYVGPLEGNATAKDAGFMVLGNVSAAVRDARAVLIWIPILGLLGFLVSAGLVLIFFQRFLKPFEQIDHGVLEIINGNLDHWFEAAGHELPNTMSQNLNIMVCLLSGRPLPEEDDAAGGEHWAEERMFMEEIAGSEFHTRPLDAAKIAAGEVEGLPSELVRLVQEDDESYRRRLFKDYVDGLRQTGEPIQGITFEKFVSRINASAQSLVEKYGCAQVRFVVAINKGRVSLRPVPIN